MNLSDTYSNLLESYDINTAGEMVEQFSDKGTRHSYIDVYQQILQPYHPTARILEIGVMTGASLLLWKHWFDSPEITGLDLRQGFNESRPWHELLTEPDIDIHWSVDSTKPSIFPEARRFDIIIDDGSHRVEDQMKTFMNYFDHLTPGGIYIIEDIENDDSFDRLEYYVHRRIQKYGTPSGYRVDSHRGYKNGRKDDQMLWVQLKK